MSTTGKDVIYIDVDDEITSLVDKVRSSPERIVALVLPKRATVLQSIVNMKLLKRTADEAKKHIVLITNETGLLPLAGSVGLFVAKNLQSKPEVPAGPSPIEEDMDTIEEPTSMVAPDSSSLDKSKSVGELSRGGVPSVASTTSSDSDEDTIELDNAEMTAPAATGGKPFKNKKEKRLKIPDFNRFRLLLVLGGVLLVVLIAGWWLAFVKLPKATVLVKTDSTAVNSNLDVRLNTEADKIDVDEGVVPAESQQTQKTSSQQVEATGTKDKGEKAKGSITASIPCSSDAPAPIPAGSGVGAGGMTFITQQQITFSPQIKGGKCQFSGSANVVAQQSGDKYNLAPRSDYKIAGYPSFAVAGSQMTGGTTNIVKVVSQADIDNAKQKMTSQDATAVKQELKSALAGKNLFAIEATLNAGNPEVTTTAQVGDEAANVTVTQKVTYTMLGVKEDDLEKIIDNAVAEKIDPKKQSILDYGISKAGFNLANQSDGGALVGMEVTTIAGPDLKPDELKKEIVGKKANDAKEILKEHPGVTNVEVSYSPFWVSAIPKNTSKITLVIEEPKVTSNDQR